MATVKGLLEQGRLRLVEKHVKSILQKLRLAPADTDHRRVLAVLRFLEAR